MRNAHLSRLYAEAESRGLRVRAEHRRCLDGVARDYPIFSAFALRSQGLTPAPKGGRTAVFLIDETGQAVASGFARCSPHDHYDKRRGVEIALGRALRSLLA